MTLTQNCKAKALLKRHGARSVTIPLGAFGALTEKKVTLWRTWPMLKKLAEQGDLHRGPAMSGPRSLSGHAFTNR